MRRTWVLLGLLAVACTDAPPSAVDRRGQPLDIGGERVMDPVAGGTHLRHPAVAVTDTTFYVAWEERRADGGPLGIAGVALNAQGQGTPFSLSLGLAPEQVVALAPYGSNAVAAWSCGGRVCTRLLTPGGPGGGTQATPNLNVFPYLGLSGSSSAPVLSWTDLRVGPSLNVYACKLDAALTCVPPTGVAVRPDAGIYESENQVLALGDDLVVAWYDTSNGSDVYLQLVSDGGVAGGRGNVACCPSGNAKASLVERDAGGVWLTWDDGRAGRNVYLRAFDSAMATVAGTEQAIANSADVEANPNLALDPSRGLQVIAWENQTSGNVEAKERSPDGGLRAVIPLGVGMWPKLAFRSDGRGVLAVQRAVAGEDRIVIRLLGPDGGPPDAGPVDSGVDAGAMDSGIVDAGPIDSGVADSGVVDAGAQDSGVNDAGVVDAGEADAGVDAGSGSVDGGMSQGPESLRVGCGCDGVPGVFGLVALLALRRRRR